MSTDYNTDTTTPSHQPDTTPRHLSPGVRLFAIIVAVLVLLGIAYRIFGHFADEHALESATRAGEVPIVRVVHPTITGATSEIELPGNTQAYDDTPIYARTSGYLKQWFVDIGAHVTKGQLMATIETPELDEQL